MYCQHVREQNKSQGLKIAFSSFLFFLRGKSFRITAHLQEIAFPHQAGFINYSGQLTFRRISFHPEFAPWISVLISAPSQNGTAIWGEVD